MNQKHGQTEEISRRREISRTQAKSQGVGRTGHKSLQHGADSICSGGEDRIGGNSTGFDAYDGCTPVGKILQRLELVEQFYLEYVHDHQNKLEARLDESKGREEAFKEAIAELKQEIYNLATEATTGNGDDISSN